MIRKLLIAALLSAAPALAQDAATLERRGNWTSFVARTTNNNLVCGVDVYDDRDGRHFMMKWIQNNPRIIFHVVDPRWRMRPGFETDVVLRIDGNIHWNAPAVSNTLDTLEWNMTVNHIPRFENQFRFGHTMYISFPRTNERTWTISLSGTNAIVNSLVECIHSARNAN